MADPTVNHLGPLDNLRSAYSTLNDTVVRALLTQVGDSNRLAQTRSQVFALLQAAEPVSTRRLLSYRTRSYLSPQHRDLFPPEEYAVLQQSISTMVEQLDAACHQSMDPPDGPHLVIASRYSTGRQGRPKVEVSLAFLSQTLQH